MKVLFGLVLTLILISACSEPQDSDLMDQNLPEVSNSKLIVTDDEIGFDDYGDWFYSVWLDPRNSNSSSVAFYKWWENRFYGQQEQEIW